LLAYVVTAGGIPIPLASLPKESGELFPCMAGSCGCSTADQCWRSCCCHSLDERIAWAYRRGIQPPAFVAAQARAAGIDLAWLTRPSRNTSNEATSCCRAQQQVRPNGCCPSDQPETQSKGIVRSCREKPFAKAGSDDGGDKIVAWRALACRGQSMNWLSAVPPLISLPPELVYELPLTGWLSPPRSDWEDGQSSSPAVPPPELS
jgi:hypothetical protein